MTPIHSLLAEHALTEARDAVGELEEVLNDLGYELPEGVGLDDIPELVEGFLQAEDVNEEAREQLDEIIKRVARGIGRAVGTARRIRKAVGTYKKGVKKAFRAGEKRGRTGKRPVAKKRAQRPTVRRPAARRPTARRPTARPTRRTSRPSRAGAFSRRGTGQAARRSLH